MWLESATISADDFPLYLISVAREPIVAGAPAAPEAYVWACLYVLAAWVLAALIAIRSTHGSWFCYETDFP